MDSKKGIVVIDCDGCLTDGKLYIDHKGEKMFKAFSSRDIRAIRELIFNGYEVVIVSADDSGINKSFAENVGAIFEYCRDKSEIKADFAIGDDVWDKVMLEQAGKAFCPFNADDKIKEMLHVTTLKKSAGEGVIAEMIQHIL